MIPLILLACNPDTTDTTDAVAVTATWQGDVRPIIESRCVSCHTEGGAAPFALETMAQTVEWGDAVVDAVVNRRMPPWGQDPDCRPAIGSLWLSDEELAALEAWQAADYPEGDEADYTAPVVAESFDPGPPDIVLTAATPITVDTTLDDDYRCMLIGEPLAEDLMIQGTLTVPENLEVAHHALLFAIPASGVDALAALDAAEDGPGYVCFGDTGLDNAQTVAGWAPGSDPDFAPEGAAIRVPAGSQFVLQMHYNNAELTSTEPQLDQTEVQLWIPDEPPTHLVISFPIAKTGLDIDAGDPASFQTQMQRIPADATIIGTAPHMHLRGTALTTTLLRADGSEEGLSDVQNYDFNWQRNYGYAEADWVPLTTDDRLEITCTYDNADNPDAITWGDGSGDEMCLNYLALLVPFSGGEGVCAGYETCSDDCGDDMFCRMACLTASGESCLYCGLDGLFGDCNIDGCYPEIVGLYPCLQSCADGDETAYVDCMYDECRAAFDTYAACSQEQECSADYAACDLSGL